MYNITMNYSKRYDDNGNVAILISPGFGAGWSTWTQGEQAEAMLFDSRLVDYVLQTGAEGLDVYAESLGYTGYMGGAEGVVVQWLEPGTRFLIDEYDGSESIRTFDDLCHVA
jgi:hypothetical protein